MKRFEGLAKKAMVAKNMAELSLIRFAERHSNLHPESIYRRARIRAHRLLRRAPASGAEIINIMFNGKERPLDFRTHDGKSVRIARHGFEDILHTYRKKQERPMILALIDGERLFFYRSSGANSRMRGEWLPTRGPIVLGSIRPHVHKLVKMEGHPERDIDGGTNIRFPAWVSEIRGFIKENEPLLKLHPEWDVRTYKLLEAELAKTRNTRHLRTLEDTQRSER